MKYIKLLFFSGVVLLLVLTGVTLLLPSHVRVSRAVNLNAGADSVLNLVSDLSKWERWYPGFDTLELKAAVTENGRIVKASVKNVQLQVTTDTDSLVTVEMKKGAQPVFNNWKLIRYAHSDSLTLQNYMDFDFKWYPWERFAGLLVDRSYGQLMEAGLKRLKEQMQE
ncbi:SRPBCC family protein [Niabella drilacis]|uniref:Polyketide cyclase / dehydrase and lipid transport n=1 Tax=Niabella drilacis (strain DSM 25811 / CCM 8410 / CCUG 62505 / LMG 26954 / E90) TaxID=1285928 RepID=A0A1G6L2C6_NIADE|nr:SRPBCC family protein [Niabella drilacis]SDC36885.1 Polyketide cyclase / dehydrase and lipid transport [Niabella drilacis]